MKVEVTRGRVGFAICAVLLLSACSTSEQDKKVLKENAASLIKNTRPVKATFRFVDQEGVGARNYRLKLGVNIVHRFLGLSWHGETECHILTTDEEGYIHLDWPGKLASSVSFKEVDIDRYIFSKGLEKIGGVSMPALTDVQTPAEFMVVRHGPPVQLVKFSTPYRDFTIKETSFFAVRLRDGSIEESSGGGDLVIQVSNAKEASEAAKMYSLEVTANIRKGTYEQQNQLTPVHWSVSVSTAGSLAFRETVDEHLSFAPLEGYVRTITWDNVLGAKNGGPKYFFAKNEETSEYSWFYLHVGFGKFLDVHLEGYTNPDKSNNLYMDRWPFKEEFRRYSERCP